MMWSSGIFSTLEMVDPVGQSAPVSTSPLEHVTSENCLMMNAPLAGLVFVTAVTMLLATLRRKRFRPWLPTYATVADMPNPSSRWTDAVYW